MATAMEQQSAFSPAEWGEALRQCVTSRSLSVLREQVLLVFVEPHAVFHPLHALVPLVRNGQQQSQTAFVAVMRLHEQVTAVVKELQVAQSIHNSDKADICHAVLENVVFVDRPVDAVSAKRANDASGRVASAVPFFYPREVNLSGGALCSFAADEASAKAALADITIAVQSFEEEEETGFIDAETPLVVVVEHGEGYIGQTFDGQLVSSIIRVKKTPFTPNEISFDSVLEAYEEDFRDQMEINGIADQPQQLAVNVQAGFSVSSYRHSSSISSASPKAALGANLISSWSGIENIRSLYCKPPPNSSSLVCLGGAGHDSDLHLDSSLPRSSSVKSMEPFPAQVRHTIGFLNNLENSIHDSTFERLTNGQVSTSEESDRNYLLRKFRSFLGDPDASQEDTIDLNSTMELNIVLNFEREDDLIKNRTDLDFLEKMWEFVLANVASAEGAVQLVQEFLVTFATARVIPLVHPANPTRLGEFLKTRVEASRSAGSEGTAGSQQRLQAQLSIPHEALLSLFELGEWKLQRDIASWFTQIGFTAAESALIIDQFQLQVGDASESHKYKHAAVERLVDVCATAFSLGISGSLLRKLANDCLGYFTRQQGDASGTSAPVFVLPLNSFIPDRIRANLGDALFWDLEMSFGELLERKVRICESSFHHKCGAFDGEEDADTESKLPSGSREFTLALDPKMINQLHHHLPEDMLLHPIVLAFVRNAEINEEDKLPTPVGLVQYECTTRKLGY